MPSQSHCRISTAASVNKRSKNITVISDCVDGSRGLRATRKATLKNRAIIAAGYAALTISYASILQKCCARQPRKVPRYRRQAIMRPILGTAATPWKRLLVYGSDADFIISIIVTRPLLFDCLLPILIQCDKMLTLADHIEKHGSARPQSSVKLSRYTRSSIVVLKSRCPLYKLCTVFGVVPSSMYVWLDFGLEVLLRVVQNPAYVEYEIRWPIETEMRASAALLERNRQYGALLRGVLVYWMVRGRLALHIRTLTCKMRTGRGLRKVLRFRICLCGTCTVRSSSQV